MDSLTIFKWCTTFAGISTVLFTYSTLYVASKGIKLSSSYTSVPRSKRLTDHVTPLCLNNMLDRRNYNFDSLTSQHERINLTLEPPAQPHSCRLINYTAQRAVACVDIMNRKNVDWRTSRSANRQYDGNISNTDPGSMTRVVFIGDSRIRQQFFNFLKLFPEYDRQSDPNPIPLKFHGHIDVTSNLLQLKVSFRWHPLLTNETLNTFRDFEALNADLKPHLILIGMVSHHLRELNGDSMFKTGLAELGPILNRLAKISHVIWLNGYPIFDFVGAKTLYTKAIYSEKISHYNQVVRNTFSIYDNIIIWDSSNPFAEEYVRGCYVFFREAFDTTYTDSYTNCKDFIHTGNVALFDATQILANHFCNYHVSRSQLKY